MNMPGFTAESSVYRTMGYYRAMAGHPTLSANAAVLPQLARQLKLLRCLENCALADAPDYCQQLCFWEESIAASEEHFGGAAKKGGGSPDWACIQCKSECGKKPPAQRAACRQDCEEFVC